MSNDLNIKLFNSYKKVLYYHYFNENEELFKKEILNFKNLFITNRKLKGSIPIISKDEINQFCDISKKYILIFVNNFLNSIKNYFIVNFKKSYKEINELIANILYNQRLQINNNKIENIKNNYFKDKRFILYKLNNIFNIIVDFYELNDVFNNKLLELNNINSFNNAVINKINIIDIKHKINYDNQIISIFGNNVINYLFL